MVGTIAQIMVLVIAIVGMVVLAITNFSVIKRLFQWDREEEARHEVRMAELREDIRVRTPKYSEPLAVAIAPPDASNRLALPPGPTIDGHGVEVSHEETGAEVVEVEVIPPGGPTPR